MKTISLLRTAALLGAAALAQPTLAQNVKVTPSAGAARRVKSGTTTPTPLGFGPKQTLTPAKPQNG